MKYVQIGVTALRSPTGEFLPSVPMYIAVDDDSNTKKLLDEPLHEVSGIFAEKYYELMQKRKKKTAKQVEAAGGTTSPNL